jgi:hypothetical protein
MRTIRLLVAALGVLPAALGCSGGGGAAEGGGVGLEPPCGANPVAHVAFNIENMWHANDAVLIDQNKFAPFDTPGIYYKGNDVTSMAIYDRDQDGATGSHVEVTFQGDVESSEKLGTMTDGALQFDSVRVHIFLPGEDFICCDDTTPGTDMGTIAVTEFAMPGGLIKGTFQGNFDGASAAHGSISAMISNGSFAVTRCNDGF